MCQQPHSSLDQLAHLGLIWDLLISVFTCLSLISLIVSSAGLYSGAGCQLTSPHDSPQLNIAPKLQRPFAAPILLSQCRGEA